MTQNLKELDRWMTEREFTQVTGINNKTPIQILKTLFLTVKVETVFEDLYKCEPMTFGDSHESLTDEDGLTCKYHNVALSYIRLCNFEIENSIVNIYSILHLFSFQTPIFIIKLI